MTNSHPPTLFDEASARLPIFDTLPEGAVERLAAGGFGRGLMTATIRARLRKTGFADMGALALATPADLTAVRKIGPVRVRAIRAHVLGELARLFPGARADHDEEATGRRRLDRLRAVPVGPFAGGGLSWAELALIPRSEATRTLALSAADLDRVVAALGRVLATDPPRSLATAAAREDDAGHTAQARAELQRMRDREWDEAAPVRGAAVLSSRPSRQDDARTPSP